jgi:hypothetical protein
MTQQSDADARGDNAAEDATSHAVHRRRACGIDPVRTRWPSLPHPKEGTPTEMWTALARLESAFPAFSFAICRGWGGPRFEAWRDTARSGLYAIITDDPRELWHELRTAPQ